MYNLGKNGKITTIKRIFDRKSGNNQYIEEKYRIARRWDFAEIFRGYNK